ncbi:MAG TPA: ATP-binding protein [Candidatus Limnocylindrales bacterium]|nr:ATP-binding protein [Candidatus Limnocylindrales bacterium]
MLALLDFRVRQRDFLLEITKAITAQLDLTEVLRRVLYASLAMLGGQVGLVALPDSTGQYRVRAVEGIPPARMAELTERLVELTELVKRGANYAEIDEHLRTFIGWVDTRMVQALALPMMMGDEPRGLLVVGRTFEGKATPDDVQVLQSFADQAAIAVNNAQLYERIDQERRRFAAIVQHSADGVMVLDGQLNILSFNRALERMTGWRAQDVIGAAADQIIVWKRLEHGDLRKAIDDGWPRNSPASSGSRDETVYVEGDLQRRDGLSVSVGIRYAPLVDADGNLTTLIANVRDITNFRHAQEMQNAFISTVSHELKTPVALIKGHAATLRREDVEWTDQIVREYSGVIEEESDRLTELIESLLTASKLQAEGGMRLYRSEVKLDALAERAVERFSKHSTRHRFTLAFPSDYPSVLADEGKLRQVLDNLLSNAIKYSPDGGVIEVGGQELLDAVSVYVRDQGVGLSELDQERIFERFYRVDGALTRRTAGTGLGLYLSRAIIEAHGGSISVVSSPGNGATFTFTLPLQPPYSAE